MKIAAIGSFYEHDFVDSIKFSSSISFLDYDVLLLDFKFILDEYKATVSGTYQGYKCLNDDDSARIILDIDRRKLEIIELLKLGRTIIVFTPSDTICFVDTGRRTYSGTGKNRQTTRIVESINLLSVIPQKFHTVKASGQNIDFRGDESFSFFWKSNKKNLSFDAYFQEPIGKPIFYVKGTDKVVGSYVNIGNGCLLFIPTFQDDNEDEKVENIYFKSIFQLIGELKKDTGDFELPAWCEEYVLPQELDEKNALKKFENKLNDLNNKISIQKKKIEQLKEYKILFAGSGKALEIQVGKIFSELGFEVAEGLPGRDDLILKYKDKVAVVEVKGVSKSAAEKHAAQLEKWVSEYYESHEIMPKGLLVVNPYNEMPLTDRKEDAFPSQMIQYSENRDHCLITGIQLLELYFYFIDNKAKGEEVVNSLFSTNGVFNSISNWTNFINKVSITDKDC